MRCKICSFVVLCALMVTSLASAAGLSITTMTLPAATAGVAYTATLTASGGMPPYTWKANSLPAGLTLDQTGTITGIPTAGNSCCLMFNVTDSQRITVSKSFSLVIAKAQVSPIATLTASLLSPQKIGPVVTFTAAVTNLPEQFEYQFMYKDPASSTLLTAQRYSTSKTWSMNTQNFKPNTYPITVYVRRIGSTAVYDSTSTLSFTILPPPPATGLLIASTYASPQDAGKHITFTASLSNTDPAKYYYYQFTITSPDGTTKRVLPSTGDFTSAQQWMWNTFGSEPGDYIVTVYAKQFYASAYETVASMKFTLNPPLVSLPVTDPYKNGQVYIEKSPVDNPGYYVAGSTYVGEVGITSTEGYGAFVAKYDADWNLVWKRFALPYSGGWVTDSKLDKAGNLAVVGYGAKAFFRKYDSDGNLVASWDAPTLSASPRVVFDDANNAYIGREDYKSGMGSTIYVTKLDAAGTESWTWQSSPTYITQPTVMNNGPRASLTGIAIGADGNLHISGKTSSSVSGMSESNVSFAGISGAYFLTIDPFGNELYGINVVNTGGGALFTDSQGNFITIGAEAAAAGTPAAWDQTKFDITGSVIWQNPLFENPTNQLIRDVAQDEQGNFYVLTQCPLDSTVPLISNQYLGVVITKIDADGKKLWTATGGTTDSEPLVPLKISVDGSGNSYVQTTTTLPIPINGSKNFPALIRFDATGKQVWMK